MTIPSAVRRRAATGLGALALWLLAAGRCPAGFTMVSMAGASGSGGVLTASEINPVDATSANVNASFTGLGAIPVTFTVSDGSPVSLYGTAVNFTGSTWSGLSARIVAVDPATGQVRRVASGFNGPPAILADDAAGRLLVANRGDRLVYSVRWAGP